MTRSPSRARRPRTFAIAAARAPSSRMPAKGSFGATMRSYSPSSGRPSRPLPMSSTRRASRRSTGPFHSVAASRTRSSTRSPLVASTPALEHRTCQRSGGRVGLVEADQRLPRRRLKVPAIVVRPRRRARRGARPPAPLAERSSGWLRAPVRAPEAEVALVRGAIERRLGPDRPVIVGVAPHQATDRARGVEARERVFEVPRCLVLGQEGRGALSFGIVIARGRAELGEEDIPPAQPTRDVSEEGDELRVGRPSAPWRVDRVPMHAEDVADPRGLGWPDPSIILEVLHVQPERDRARSVGGSDGPDDSLEPAHAVLGARRHAAVRVLIAKIPRPQGGMCCESAGALAREQSLRLEDERVHVPVAHPPLHEVIVRDDPKPSALDIAREGPWRHEVRSAHVTREERGDDPETMAPRGVGHGHEERQGAIADRRRLRLEVLPQQEEPDELAARVTDTRVIAIDLALV